MIRGEVKQIVRRSAWLATLGLIAAPVMAGGISIGVNIGIPVPPPVVVVQEQPVTYDVYVMGYRRQLYDADLALRLARADEFAAYDELQAARRHEADVAAQFDDNQVVIADLHRRVGSEDIAAIHADVLATSDRIADLHKQLDALDHRIAGAKEDFDAAKILNDSRGMDQAGARIRENEDRSKTTAADLRGAEDHLAAARDAEAAASASAADRDRLHVAEDRAVALQHDLDVAHDAVFNTERRWEDARERVFVCMHDRDEALWLLHRDDIYAGRIDLATCGFSIDLAVWGGHLPRDPEVVHLYLVHDVGYWRANPVIIENRCVEVTRITEITKIRQITKMREVEKVRTVERVEAVKIEDRRHYAEVVVDEHKRFEAETTERKAAVAEHRAPWVTPFIERANQAHAEAAVANHNAAVAEKTAARDNDIVKADNAKIAQQQKEIDQSKAADTSASATDSRAARARRRAAEDQSSATSDAKGSSSAADDSSDSRAARARRRAADDAADSTSSHDNRSSSTNEPGQH
jgi:hypothetical protein